jgi:D-3-phosphoglycerate dehydrogenase
VSSLLSYPREKIRVLLLEGIHESATEAFVGQGYTQIVRAEALPAREALADVRLLGIRSRTHVDQALLQALPKLLAIGCFCIGTNQVDLGAAAKRGVPVFNAPHSNTRSVAELVIGFTIMLLRGVFPKNRLVHEGRWPKTASGSREVRGKTIGIVGYGHIGSQVSVLAEAMGMHVLYYDIEPKLPLGNARAADSLGELLRTADIVTLHVPLTEQTDGMMNAERIGTMRPGGYLINTSRGPVVQQEPLRAALQSGHLAGAAVDVFPVEPRTKDAPLDSPLRDVEDAILTPHVAGSTLEAQEKIGREVAFKLAAYSDRGSTLGAVNFPQLSLLPHSGAHRILHIHRNVPGMLQQINAAVAEENINVMAQHLETANSIGYVVLDIEKVASTRLFARLRQIEGTVRARILY